MNIVNKETCVLGKQIGSIIIAAVVILLMVSVSPCAGDTVQTKTGRTYHGKILSLTDNMVVLQTASVKSSDGQPKSNIIRLDRKDISEITFGGVKPDSAAPDPKPVAVKPAVGKFKLASARRSVVSVTNVAKAVPGVLAMAATKVTDPAFREAAMLDLDLVVDIARGKVSERYKPLVKKLLARAYWDNNPEAPVIEDSTPLAAE